MPKKMTLSKCLFSMMTLLCLFFLMSCSEQQPNSQTTETSQSGEIAQEVPEASGIKQMDEDDFRPLVWGKTREEVRANMGEPTKIDPHSKGWFYEIWIVRDNTRYPGVTVYFEPDVVGQYSFTLKGKETLSSDDEQ